MTHEQTSIPSSGGRIERAKFWHADDIGRLELLKAKYVSHTFPRHVHEGYVIGVIESGVEAFYYRGTLYNAPAGSIVLINPDTVHTGHAGDERGWTYRTLYPSRDLLAGIAAQIADRPSGQPYFPDPVIRDPYLANLIRRMHMTLETSASVMERETRFMWAIGRLIDRHALNRPPAKRTSGDQRAVKKIRDFMAAHFSDNISLDRLSELADLSPYYLTRLFTRSTGLPPHAYLTQVRIERAKDLLRKGNPLSQVAHAAGFADQSHLTRHFKRIVGVTPGKYVARSSAI